MAKNPLPLGSWGLIRTDTITSKRTGKRAGVRARAYFRDFDGVRRLVEASGPTATAARQNLQRKLENRIREGSHGDLSGMTKYRAAADLWLERIDELVADGARSPGTVQTYRGHLENHLYTALGELRLGEITTPVVDRVIRQIKQRTSVATAKSCRSVISGVLSLAVREGAVATNPVRDASRLESGRKAPPRSLTAGERTELMELLRTHELSLRHDLPDLVFFMLATGVRIGEALSVDWSQVDLDRGTVEITTTLIRVDKEGLLRKPTKSRAGERLLPLPASAVAMLRTRFRPGTRLDMPVFPDVIGGYRDPTNVRRSLRTALKGHELSWVTTHTFRKTAATILDEAKLSARMVADHLGHSRPSMTQDIYFGRRLAASDAADALDLALLELGDLRGNNGKVMGTATGQTR